MKIALIAMSGVRARNEELTQLGLTLPGFVERNKVIASMPSLSMLTLAGLTPPRHPVEYHEIADLKKESNLPDDFDLVAITSFSAQIFEAYDLADRYREKRIPVVMGGLHVSSLPEEAKAHCDGVVIGEGEPLWPKLLADAENHSLRPYYRSADFGQFDLRQAPLPRFDLLDPDKYNRITIQTSRGCPHRCSFCASSILLTPGYKLKPVHQVIAELHAVKRIWDHPFIEFADDNSFVHRAHSKELLRALIPEDIRWFTETDLRVADDDELLALLRDSGCQQILIGLESPRADSLRQLELRADWKRRQQDRYLQAIEKIQSYGVTVNGCFILGLDGDTPDVFEEVFEFVKSSGLYEVQVTFLTPFPGTPLYARLKTENRLLADGAWDRCTLFDINFQPKGMSVQQLQTGFLTLVKKLYSAEVTTERRRKFRRNIRTSPHARRSVPVRSNEQALAAA